MQGRKRHLAKGVLVIAAIALVVVLTTAWTGAFATASAQSKLLSLQEINGRYNTSYAPISIPKCENTPLLQSSRINLVCTEALALNGSTNSSLPGRLTLFYYDFDAPQDAVSYMQNITALMNATPWAPGVELSNSILRNNNLTIYYTSIFHGTIKLFSKVYTAYAVYDSKVIGVTSVLNRSQTNTNATQSMTLNLLALQYKKLSGA